MATTELGQVVRDTYNGMNDKSQEKADKSPIRHDGPHKPALFQPHDSTRLHDSSEQNNSHKSPTKEESNSSSSSSSDAALKHEHVQEPRGVVIQAEHKLPHTVAETREKTESSAPTVPLGHVVEPIAEPEPTEHHKPAPVHPKETDEAPESVESTEEEKSEVEEAEKEAELEEKMEVDEKADEPESATADLTDAAPSADAVEKSPKRERSKSPAKITSPKKPVDESAVSPKKAPASSRKRKMVTEGVVLGGEDKTPLLEAPLVVEGKRSRQRVERLDSTVLTPERKAIEIPSGRGQKLGDIKFVESMISKTAAGSLKTIHRIVCGRAGTPNELKKNLRQFNGFGFHADSTDFQKKKKQIENLVVSELKEICDIFGLDRAHKKEEMCESIMIFLMKPADKGKPLPKTPAEKRKSSGKKGSTKKKTPGRKGKKSTGKDATSEEDAHEDEPEEAGDETPEPPTKKTKRGRPTSTPTTTPSKKSAASTSSSRSAKKAAFPTDSDIKGTIKELLKGVNLEEVTMKEMMTKVYEKYPGQDLTSKKDFIKESVKLLLSNN